LLIHCLFSIICNLICHSGDVLAWRWHPGCHGAWQACNKGFVYTRIGTLRKECTSSPHCVKRRRIYPRKE
jgi:hypothetical protein